jgi:hypothetical protein
MRQFLALLLLTASPLIFGQCLDGDCHNGNGKFKFKNGNYVGVFFNGEAHGNGLFSTRRGYSYDGEWINGVKSGFGEETVKKTVVYRGDFENNLRHGHGLAVLKDNSYMEAISYNGQWKNGTMCGEGELTYYREEKYGKQKVLEKNFLQGTFINGVFQGRQTSAYSDELKWESFGLKMEHFQKYTALTEREQKRVKNPATIEGAISLSCECLANTLIFNSSAILRQELSWWSTEIIAADTKETILAMKQSEFDIIEWYAKALDVKLNKQKLRCNSESMLIAWSALRIAEKEANQERKSYSLETAWNPKKGDPKNPTIQDKWNKKIVKKLKRYDKVNKKLISKLYKKLNKLSAGGGEGQCEQKEIDNNHIPIKKELTEKENVTANKNDLNKPRRSFRPHFPRANQLE